DDMADTYDVIIIGGGPGGYSAAVYAARFNMSTLVLAKERGGLIATTHIVENWPGEKSISGFDLVMKIEEQVKHLGVPIKDEEVKEAKKDEGSFIVKTAKSEYKAKTLILATGTTHRKLPAIGEREFAGKGVSYCATCDGMFFKGKTIAIVGGGDSAAKEAALLSDIAAKTYIIFMQDELACEPANYKRVMEKVKQGKIELIPSNTVKEIKGDTKVTSLLLEKPYKNSKELKVDGIFGAIGLIPRSEIAKQLGVALNERGEIKTDIQSKTNVPGVFAAGDVTDHGFKQAITAAAEGVHATHSAFEFLKK
ncbi:MAG: FAD-dependent oxidoreductase, partial [Nanoarchaeota archaeon]|nr:FAD-dependent oxidoreductase [Nanoarchaeota archaeon]